MADPIEPEKMLHPRRDDRTFPPLAHPTQANYDRANTARRLAPIAEEECTTLLT